MKRFLAFILLTMILASLGGCSTDVTFPIDVEGVENPSYTDAFEMELVGEGLEGGFSYWRDMATDVIYIRFRTSGGYAGQGGLTVMLDPETGLPLTYARYMEVYNNHSIIAD